MKNALILFALMLAPAQALAGDEVQTNPTGSVSISAKGSDVRTVLGDLFTQAKKNYVIEPYTFFALHLSLNDVEFEEALQLVCKLANLRYEVQNGIYFVSKEKPAVEAKPVEKAPEKPAEPAPKPVAKPKGTLPQSVLQKKLTTRLDKTDIRAVFAEISKQTGVTVEFAKTVPAYKIDAYLINTSLKYALDVVTDATQLKWRFTDNLTIEIYKPEPEKSRVVLHQD